jgi:nicotinamide-nucleotide amidase
MVDVPPSRPGPAAPARRLRVAELCAVGTELTVGETVDTNSGELARSLVAHGVTVARVSNLPDDQPVVVEALRAALARADLVVTTGGLGPTPDDLTREAVAEVCDEAVMVDEATLAWLEALWARRRLPFPSTNVKQAWRIPSATILPNPNGTAPGWWVDRPDGTVIVTLPGPPRELRPMWTDEVLPRLLARGVGADSEVRTLRLAGIGESALAERLGDLLQAPNPVVATYARHEAVDVRISARADGPRSAATVADEAEAAILALIGDHVWARGDTTWATAIADALAARDWTLATTERGTDGALVTLLRGLPGVLLAERRPAASDASAADGGREAEAGDGEVPAGRGGLDRSTGADVGAEAERVRRAGGADVGLAISVRPGGDDRPLLVGIATPDGTYLERRTTFLRGNQGPDRAAIAGASVLLEVLRRLRRGDD